MRCEFVVRAAESIANLHCFDACRYGFICQYRECVAGVVFKPFASEQRIQRQPECLIVVSESERNRRLAEATMKRLTGGDPIRARRMRQDFVQFDPSHLPMLITNHLPKVSADDAAVWRRLRVVPFDVVIPENERDGALGERLELEADGILAWAIAGWRDYCDRGALDEPGAVLAATDAYQVASDALRRFIDEECVVSSPALKATTAQLFQAFDKWRMRDGAEALSQKAFGQALDRHGYPAEKPVRGKRWRTGIALQANEEKE